MIHAVISIVYFFEKSNYYLIIINYNFLDIHLQQLVNVDIHQFSDIHYNIYKNIIIQDIRHLIRPNSEKVRGFQKIFKGIFSNHKSFLTGRVRDWKIFNRKSLLTRIRIYDPIHSFPAYPYSSFQVFHTYTIYLQTNTQEYCDMP